MLLSSIIWLIGTLLSLVLLTPVIYRKQDDANELLCLFGARGVSISRIVKLQIRKNAFSALRAFAFSCHYCLQRLVFALFTNYSVPSDSVCREWLAYVKHPSALDLPVDILFSSRPVPGTATGQSCWGHLFPHFISQCFPHSYDELLRLEINMQARFPYSGSSSTWTGPSVAFQIIENRMWSNTPPAILASYAESIQMVPCTGSGQSSGSMKGSKENKPRTVSGDLIFCFFPLLLRQLISYSFFDLLLTLSFFGFIV